MVFYLEQLYRGAPREFDHFCRWYEVNVLDSSEGSGSEHWDDSPPRLSRDGEEGNVEWLEADDPMFEAGSLGASDGECEAKH